jgi:hypothetical protein
VQRSPSPEVDDRVLQTPAHLLVNTFHHWRPQVPHASFMSEAQEVPLIALCAWMKHEAATTRLRHHGRTVLWGNASLLNTVDVSIRSNQTAPARGPRGDIRNHDAE